MRGAASFQNTVESLSITYGYNVVVSAKRLVMYLPLILLYYTFTFVVVVIVFLLLLFIKTQLQQNGQ